jgi:hypothetical protein
VAYFTGNAEFRRRDSAARNLQRLTAVVEWRAGELPTSSAIVGIDERILTGKI